jgi:hypothetical protein
MTPYGVGQGSNAWVGGFHCHSKVWVNPSVMAYPLELAILLMVIAASHLTEAVIREGMTALVEAAP